MKTELVKKFSEIGFTHSVEASNGCVVLELTSTLAKEFVYEKNGDWFYESLLIEDIKKPITKESKYIFRKKFTDVNELVRFIT